MLFRSRPWQFRHVKFMLELAMLARTTGAFAQQVDRYQGAMCSSRATGSFWETMMDHPFTEDELYRVFARFMPSEQARLLARSALSSEDLPPPAPRNGADGLQFRPIPTTTFTDDTLILLSFLSDATDEKVRAYRASVWSGKPPADEEDAWNSRRAELKAWADAGYPVEPDARSRSRD